ncbi:hypothetical protein M422DRAFT_273451 [Sphaerobolus stellatus SS14]|uniref:Uncharacterized protein n=1 Tax=Sphaerobolus stellatus (strain SS14) TaxID=990650 RepID=A0A0C9U956_SPHS4|nr:hypothetical protein M422DRAFT_273451 [Sphaerobolus stellatus SS14]
MSHHRDRRTQVEELFVQAVEGGELIPGLTAGDLMDPPLTSVDPQQSPEVLTPEHQDEPHVQAHSPQTVPSWVQSPLSMAVPSNTAMQGLNPTRLAGASGTANRGLDSTWRVAVASGTATQDPYSPWGTDQGSGSWQNLSDAPGSPDRISPDEGDMEEEENFTIPASEVNILCQKYADFVNLKDNAEIVLAEAMEATERLNTVFNRIRTSMNRMSPCMKELFIVPVTKSSGKTIEPGNNQAHDKAAAKAATEQIIVQTTINTPGPGTGTDDCMRLPESCVPHDGDRNSLPPCKDYVFTMGIPESIENSQCSIREPQSIDMNALRKEIKETISATLKEKLCSDADSATTVSQSMLALDANAQYWSDLSNKATRRSHRALELQLKLAEEKVNTLLHEEAPEEALLEAAQEMHTIHFQLDQNMHFQAVAAIDFADGNT